MGVNVTVNNNIGRFRGAMEDAIAQALEELGQAAEVHAKEKAPVDTGKLKKDITHVVEPGAVHIGNTTEVPYGKYQELGTYKMPAQPYLKPSVTEHTAEYKKIIEEALRDA